MTTIDGSNAGGGFDKFGEDAQWFREKLIEKGVRLRPGSPMDNALSAMTEIARAVNTGIEPVLKDRDALDQFLTDGVGGPQSVKFIRDADAIAPHIFDDKWHLFRGPDALLARYRAPSDERNFVWELFVAAHCLVRTADVRVAKYNENPDVRCKLDDVVWGIECKAPSSPNPDQQMKNVKKAADQLEENPDIDRGIIALNLTGALDLSRFTHSIRSTDTKMYSVDDIKRELQHQVNIAVKSYDSDHFAAWMKLTQGQPRAILFHADAIALAQKTIVRFTYQNWLNLHRPRDTSIVVPLPLVD